MKRKLFISICLMMLGAITLTAQKAVKKSKEVEGVIKQFTQALIDGNGSVLKQLTYPDLKYAHSTGLIQNRQEFIDGITSGRSDFVSIDLSEQTIDVVGKTATVRHILFAKTNDNHVPGTVRLSILLVWVKNHGHWKLLARQAVKPAN